MRIVVIEDEIRIREGIIKLLGKLNKGYEVVGEADNGRTGLELLKEKCPDIVITDIRMPEMDGLEMLQAMYEIGLNTKAIVISAYSEFEYARTAMKLGVTEYLLKPITLSAFSQSLNKVAFQIKKERTKKPDQLATLEQVFRELVAGNITADNEILDYLKHKYSIDAERPFILLCACIGSGYEDEVRRWKRELSNLWTMQSEVSHCIFESDYRKSLITVLYNYKDSHKLERWLQYHILNNQVLNNSLGWIEVESIYQLKSGFDHLYPYMDWNISLEEEILISYPKITHVQTVPCIYPIDMEKRIKTAICMNEWDKMRKISEEFRKYFQGGRIYEPKEIKECYVRFLWAVIGIAKEVGCLDDKELELERLLDMIMGAKTRLELDMASDMLLSRLKMSEEDEEITHLTVKRAKAMIHEYYQTGITLEEIASKLNITPEYLGTQFHKVIGVNFSSYIRNCRMNKAKELLCGTQLKLYEISDKVGYSNPKYFSQVFKEYTGQLPADYRKSYK
jgi:two-component system response regulator YesN